MWILLYYPGLYLAIASIFPSFKVDQLHSLTIQVQNSNRKDYRGFFDGTTIYLDSARCSRLSWAELLAHEITHLTNKSFNLAPWVDEMLAQLIEVKPQMFGFPARAQLVARMATLPIFMSNTKPI